MAPPARPRNQRLAQVLYDLEHRAQKEGKVHRGNGRWLSRAYYGLGVPSAMFATAASTTALAEETVVSGTCAGGAAVLTAIMMFLRNPDEKARAERELMAEFDGIETRAHDLRLMAADISARSLTAMTMQLEVDLTTLCKRAYAPPVPLTARVPPDALAESPLSSLTSLDDPPGDQSLRLVTPTT
jgi:hypothetical protein